MRRIGVDCLTLGLLLFFAAQPGLRADAPSQAPEFQEVYDLIRAHLAGNSGTDLNQTAVQALVSALSPKVSFVRDAASTNNMPEKPLVRRSSLFDDSIGYVRIGRVDDGVAKAVRDATELLAATNKLKGVALDLRYAGGDDYAAAAALADLFLSKDRPLLDWGQGVVHSKAKDDAIKVPVAVLVNGQTVGAAEALAAVLREAGVGLVLGTRTSGQAMIAQEFSLKDGERLRIATAFIQLGDGSRLSGQGVTPDIAVDVSAPDERAYYADAFLAMANSNSPPGGGLALTNAVSSTNRANRRPRFNEAELVRERREGLNPEVEPAPARDEAPDKPLVRDPVLARALDVLKGLAVVRQSRS
jgi:C-terminal processing protease CtpA/Prc